MPAPLGGEVRPEQQQAGFGEIWDVEFGDDERTRLVFTRLIVSSDFYHQVAEDRVLMCDVPAAGASYALSSAALAVEGIGEVHLDRITTVYRRRLTRYRGALSSEVATHVSSMLKDMIGLAW